MDTNATGPRLKPLLRRTLLRGRVDQAPLHKVARVDLCSGRVEHGNHAADAYGEELLRGRTVELLLLFLPYKSY